MLTRRAHVQPFGGDAIAPGDLIRRELAPRNIVDEQILSGLTVLALQLGYEASASRRVAAVERDPPVLFRIMGRAAGTGRRPSAQGPRSAMNQAVPPGGRAAVFQTRMDLRAAANSYLSPRRSGAGNRKALGQERPAIEARHPRSPEKPGLRSWSSPSTRFERWRWGAGTARSPLSRSGRPWFQSGCHRP